MVYSGFATQESFVSLYKGNLIALHGVLVGLTWILHDYLVTLKDEATFIWPQRPSFSKYATLWIRYYTIALLIFDTCQIHAFSIPGVTSDTLCVAIDPITRIAGAVSLWSVEIILQVRIYALYGCSRKVATINAILFAASVGVFIWILVVNAKARHTLIAEAVQLPLPGCPSISPPLSWVQWIPATAYEFVIFLFALAKTFSTTLNLLRQRQTIPMMTLLIRDNVLYFFGISALLLMNNLMVVQVTHIPWFSFGPFHAAIGVLTTRMMLSLRKASLQDHYETPQSRVRNTEPEPLVWRAATDVGRPQRFAERSFIYDLDHGIVDMEMNSVAKGTAP
ncbi:hypothetical protein CYLTODRAFT_443018 [Cylindrobasidium torrendii FP15055 ss-10]|uniref:DUF6533 domain-containing protein n=1 Tax=Cylindrobasidium torrendii FP15055 ss-10 TaxID=1314674 RepID=A0A0D7BH30_9AGAR|nr:hypothetical protein CYLTODRAFT_443018 [Cylindrobasidium torrendii FP15055 ss-10]